MAGDTHIEKKETGIISHFFFWVAVVFLVLGIYVLSFGPVSYFVGSSPIRDAIYSPLVLLSKHNLVVRRYMLWYLSWWYQSGF
jgi:hypothetical protein